MSLIRAWASPSRGKPLEPYEFDPGPLAPDDVEVAVEYCGVCHSDLSMIDNEWGSSVYPLVPGHEVVGRVAAAGPQVQRLKVGDRVGIGWNACSCSQCNSCLAGDQHLCAAAQGTIVGRAGGFADRVRAHWSWAIPVPEALDVSACSPLLCGGITVFNPLQRWKILPTARAGVVGIGGLGHMALKFLRAWGCEVTAFTSSPSKFDEAKSLGAHRVVSSRDSAAIQALAGSLDLLLVTVNVPLEWPVLMGTLAPHGRLHVVGAVLQPIPVNAFDLIGAEREVSGSPTGSPVNIATMFQFAARHQIAPQVEHFPLSRVNEALERLRAGKVRYRVVLDVERQ